MATEARQPRSETELTTRYARAMADENLRLQAEVDRLNRAITRVLTLIAPETAMAVQNGYDGTRLFTESDIRAALDPSDNDGASRG